MDKGVYYEDTHYWRICNDSSVQYHGPVTLHGGKIKLFHDVVKQFDEKKVQLKGECIQETDFTELFQNPSSVSDYELIQYSRRFLPKGEA